MSSFFVHRILNTFPNFRQKKLLTGKALFSGLFCLFKIISPLLKKENFKACTLLDVLIYPPPELQIGLVGCLRW